MELSVVDVSVANAEGLFIAIAPSFLAISIILLLSDETITSSIRLQFNAYFILCEISGFPQKSIIFLLGYLLDYKFLNFMRLQ